MNSRILSALTAIMFLLVPKVNYGQAPDLGTAANFVLFTSTGAVTNSSPSQLTGNVGSNSGSSTGFGNVNGVMDNDNVASGQCSADLLTAYHELDTTTPTFYPSSPLIGNGDTLIAGVYSIATPATLSLNLVLDAKGNANAVFIFQIAGALSTSAASKTILINGALACNVFWKVEGLVSVAPGATMRGTIIANNAAISMSTNDTLEGRALSTAGAVSVGGMMAYTPIGCGSAILYGPPAPSLGATANYGIFSSDGPVSNTGITHVVGDIGTNVGLTTGFDSSFVTGEIHPIPDSSTAACATNLLSVYNYLEALPYDIQLLYPAQFGSGLVLTPHTYLLSGATTFTGTVYLNAEGNADAVFVIQIDGALTSGTYSDVKLINGTQAKNVYWSVDGAVNIGSNSVFSGMLIANNGAINFSSGDTVDGSVFTTDGAITISGSDIAGTGASDTGSGTSHGGNSISGPSRVCVGSSILLTDTTSGGVWSSSNGHATVLAGVVTGITPGVDTISYTVLSDTSVATKIITIGLPPYAGIITGASSVCVGSSILLTDTTTGGVWSSSNANATVVAGLVTGITSGVDSIWYIFYATCGTDTAQKIITVNIPDAGTIYTDSSICVGSSVSLMDSVSGGIWSVSNGNATISGGVITGVSAGIDTISYVVSGPCGTATSIAMITVNPLPSETIIATEPPSLLCDGVMYQNFGSANLPDANTTFNWTAINATVWAQGTDHQYSLVNFNVAGAASVTLTTTLVSTGCSRKNTVAVTVGSTEDNMPQVIYSESNLICLQDNVVTYQWGYDDYLSLDSTILTGEINQNYSIPVLDATKFYWVITSYNDCMQKTYYLTPSAGDHRTAAPYAASVKSTMTATEVNIYPNPANDNINVVITTPVTEDIRVTVLNLLGQQIISTKAVNNQANINIAGLPAGAYLVNCYQAGARISATRFTKN